MGNSWPRMPLGTQQSGDKDAQPHSQNSRAIPHHCIKQASMSNTQATSQPAHQVVDVGDVAGGGGRAVLLKQPHQVAKLAVQVAKDLDGRCTIERQMTRLGATR